MTIILAIGAFQAFFFALILIKRKPVLRVNKILSAWLAVIALHLVINYAESIGYYHKMPQLIGLSSSFILLYGPFLFLYVRDFAGKDRKYDLWHFLPFLIYNVSLLNFYLINDYDRKMQLVADFKGLATTLFILKFFSIGCYAVLSLWLVHHSEKEIKHYYSNSQDVNLNWLKYLISSILLLLAFILVLKVIDLRYLEGVHTQFEVIAFLGVSLWIFSLVYYGIRKTPVFSISSSPEVQPKYAKTKIDDRHAQEYSDRLSKFMEEETPFLDKHLTLEKLAKLVDLPAHQVSQVINNRFHKNFYEFINSYRIKEMEIQMKDPVSSNLTLLAIALNSGFSSKASFNRTFKQLTGSTPSRYFKTLPVE